MNELADWLDEWLLDVRGRGADDSPSGTVAVYRRSVRQFLAWLATEHPDVTTVAQLTPKHINGWMAHLVAAGRAEATRRVRGIALRQFLKYVTREPDSGLTVNPAAELALPVPKSKPVAVLSDEDLVALLRTMAGSTFVDRRDTAIVRLLLDTGCRRAELVGIDVADLDLRHQAVMLHGKGRKDRIVPFGDRTALALRRYLRTRATRPAAGHPALFLSIRSDPAGGWRMTGGGVYDMIGRRCENAQLGHVFVHQFRHTWAHDMLAAGAGESDVERLAGWSTPLMVRRYGSSVADERARASARRLARGDRV